VCLLAEFACDLFDFVRERSPTEATNLGRYIQYVFGVDDELLLKTKDFYKNDKAMLKKVLNFLGKTNATTSMNKARMAELHKAKIVLTTHESIQNLACAGLVEGKVAIYDEAPAACSQVHKLRQDQTRETHIESYLYDAKCIDLPKQEAKRIGKYLSTGVWQTTQDYSLTPEEIELLNSTSYKRYYRAPAERSCSDLTPKKARSAMTTDPRKEGSVVKIPSEPFQAKSNHFTHFYVSYLNLDSFKAKSVTILTACPEGTSVAALEQFSGAKFLTLENDESKARRAKVEAAAVLCGGDDASFSCSKANSKTRSAEGVVQALVDICVEQGDNAYAVAHGWMKPKVDAAGIASCKVNQTGSNSFKDKHFVGVFNILFATPEEKIIESHIFGEAFERREKMVMASGQGQSIMRSALRKQEPEETVICFFDERVKELWDLFVNS
jgi:hypothetical protein